MNPRSPLSLPLPATTPSCFRAQSHPSLPPIRPAPTPWLSSLVRIFGVERTRPTKELAEKQHDTAVQHSKAERRKCWHRYRYRETEDEDDERGGDAGVAPSLLVEDPVSIQDASKELTAMFNRHCISTVSAPSTTLPSSPRPHYKLYRIGST
ncbi:hypothetical protein D9619_011380 [Psilocybe cf. subviscida]|uniref:Uncharacterized protein n=1 Tax=Psilocybe cf. subviscida TaxID=2480587 RepID=A0A8H5BKD2_9AGAR|nr:hypothetical protein D9619_011380 [Psilocybe cf. subviscida]